jgi:hypothetical protein
VGAAAQEATFGRSFQALRADVSQVQAMRGVVEIRAEWPPASVASMGRRAPAVSKVLSRRIKPGVLRRERRPELSADRLVVVVLDQQGRELDWRLVPNPNVVRAEWAGADGQFVRGTAPTPSGDLLLVIPDLPGAVSLRIYEPRLGDDGFALALAAELSLEAR